MSTPLAPPKVTAAQLHTFSRNVNDKKVMDEVVDFVKAHDLDPTKVAAITIVPSTPEAKAHVLFEVYATNEDGQRYEITTSDGGRAIATETEKVELAADTPLWWNQAARTEVIRPAEVDA